MKMLAVVKEKSAPGATVKETDVPTLKVDELLLKVKAASICGSDLHVYNWDPWAQGILKPPRILGHEFCGEVVEVGRKVNGFKVGDFVSAESHISCGECFQCRSDNAHICEHVQLLGVNQDGGFAQYVAIPAKVAWKHTRPMPPEIASIHEPMGNSVHAVMETRREVEGRTAAVFGCGPTGLFAIGIAKAVGAKKVFAVDVNPHRLELAKAMKADEAFDGVDAELAQKIVARSERGRGVDVIYEMSGSTAAVANALKCLRLGGTLVAFGIPSKPLEIDWADGVIMKGIKIVGIFGRRIFKTWEQMRKLLESGRFDPSPVITHRFKLNQFDEAMRTIMRNDVKCGKVVLFP